ncbi:MAG TPA: aspartate kinase [Kofleriaceae bacterium]|nr:aspartate kinase [Kofleriaceae bacterium]
MNHPSARYIVSKFGGTSVATRSGWQAIVDVVRRHRAAGEHPLVVCSAVSGVTDRLVALADSVMSGGDAAPALAEIGRIHRKLARELEVDASVLAGEERSLASACEAAAAQPSARARAAILAHGELISTRLGTAFVAKQGLAASWLDARTLLRARDDVERDERYLSASCDPLPRDEMRAAYDATQADVVITQGFIAGTADGATALLGRGGSDASAAYLAAGIGAVALEVWTDVPGVFTADPRRIPDARMVQRLSYSEAEAAGALGAKVLHPRTIEPARISGVPIRIGWTGQPEVAGTRIARTLTPSGVKAIVSRRNLVLLAMWRPSSWQPVGFMAAVAARFARLGLSMDLIASSPSEIRTTVDLAAFPTAVADLEKLCADLEPVCRPRVVSRVACVSAVGAGVPHDIFAHVPAGTTIHLVSHAANGCHVSIVVDQEAEPEIVAAAHARMMAQPLDEATFGPTWSELKQPPVAKREPELAAQPLQESA